MYIVQMKSMQFDKTSWATLSRGFALSGFCWDSIEDANKEIEEHKMVWESQFKYRILGCEVVAPSLCTNCETNSGIDLT